MKTTILTRRVLSSLLALAVMVSSIFAFCTTALGEEELLPKMYFNVLEDTFTYFILEFCQNALFSLQSIFAKISMDFRFPLW